MKSNIDSETCDKMDAMAPPQSKSAVGPKQRILDAAAKVFRDKGYANARLSDVAQLAGCRPEASTTTSTVARTS